MKDLKTFIAEGREQMLLEVLSSSNILDWEDNTDYIDIAGVEFSGSFEMDGERYNVIFLNRKRLFGRHGRYVNITRETSSGRQSKTLNLPGKDILIVLRTALDITRHYLTYHSKGRRVTGLAFFFPRKHIQKAKTINRIIQYAFKNNQRLSMSLVGADENENRLRGKDFGLYYTVRGSEFEGDRFEDKQLDQTELFLSLYKGQQEPISPEEAADISSSLEVSPRAKAGSFPEFSIQSLTPIGGSVTSSDGVVDDIEDIEDEVTPTQEPEPETVAEPPKLYEVPQSILELEGEKIGFRSSTSTGMKYGAPKGTYTILFNIKPYTDDPDYFTADEASIETYMTGDEGKLKYSIQKRHSVDFYLNRYKKMEHSWPESKINPKAISKAHKEALSYYESRVDLSDKPAGAQIIKITNQEEEFARDTLPPLDGDILELYKMFAYVTRVYGNLNYLHDYFNSELESQGYNVYNVLLRAYSTHIPKIDKDAAEFMIAKEFGVYKKYSKYEKAFGKSQYYGGDKVDKIYTREREKIERLTGIVMNNTDDLAEYLNASSVNAQNVEDLDISTFWAIYDYIKGNLPFGPDVGKKPKPSFEFSGDPWLHKDFNSNVTKNELKALVISTAKEARDNGSNHTLQDVLTYGNEDVKGGAMLLKTYISDANDVDEPAGRITRILIDKFSTSELEDISRMIGPEMSVLFGIENYSDDHEVFKIGFVESWTMMGGSDAQATAFAWMNDFPPYNKNNLYVPGDNIYTDKDESKQAKDHFWQIYEETQDFFKKNLGSKYKDGKGTVKLYRGISFNPDQAKNYIPGAIESWSKAKSTATKFAKMMAGSGDGTVLEATVPYDGVFATYESLRGYFPPEINLKGKKEYIVFGGVLNEYGATIADKDELISFSEWIEQFNEENDMGMKIRILTTDDEDFEDLLSSDSIATGIDPEQDKTKTEFDEFGNFEEYPSEDDEDVVDDIEE